MNTPCLSASRRMMSTPSVLDGEQPVTSVTQLRVDIVVMRQLAVEGLSAFRSGWPWASTARHFSMSLYFAVKTRCATLSPSLG